MVWEHSLRCHAFVLQIPPIQGTLFPLPLFKPIFLHFYYLFIKVFYLTVFKILIFFLLNNFFFDIFG